MKCLITEAGRGSRLRQLGDSRLLVPVLGVPLIERVVRSAMEAGADDFYVVTGYQRERVSVFLGDLAARLGICITPIFNEDWEKEDDLSLLKAREYLSEPFLLLTAHHLIDSSIAGEMVAHPLAEGEIRIAVDADPRNSLLNLTNVTRIKTKEEKIQNIGKDLSDFNRMSTGIFLCTPAIFEALERSAEEHHDRTLSGAVRILAAEGRAGALDITGRFWIDMTDAGAFERAERALLANLKGKPNDSFLLRYFYRPLSTIIGRRLVNHKITPNQITLFSFLCSMLSAGLFAMGGYLALFLGGFLAQFSMIIDCCDGLVARLKFQGSDYGGWLDAVVDRYADAFMLFGLMWHAYSDTRDSLILFIGFLAIIGSFVLSYTADKYDSIMCDRITHTRGLRLGREVRIFLIFLGAVFNQIYLTLLVIAVVMNIETIRRVIICRDNE